MKTIIHRIVFKKHNATQRPNPRVRLPDVIQRTHPFKEFQVSFSESLTSCTLPLDFNLLWRLLENHSLPRVVYSYHQTTHYSCRSSRYTSWIKINPEREVTSPVSLVRLVWKHTSCFYKFYSYTSLCVVFVRISCSTLLADNNYFETAACDEPPLRSSTCRRR